MSKKNFLVSSFYEKNKSDWFFLERKKKSPRILHKIVNSKATHWKGLYNCQMCVTDHKQLGDNSFWWRVGSKASSKSASLTRGVPRVAIWVETWNLFFSFIWILKKTKYGTVVNSLELLCQLSFFISHLTHARIYSLFSLSAFWFPFKPNFANYIKFP